jgi:phenylalanyl-tRNA synthetase beta chain
MKVPLKWLKDYVDVTLPATELAKKLTLAGFEVAEIIMTGEGWDNIIVGQITAINPHPNADRLRLATVDLGGETETVVCGAPNLNVGDKIAFARTGARLINPYNGQIEQLKPAKIRGVESRGMICSEKELGMSESHEGILVLRADAKTGTPLAALLGSTVLDIDVTANRPDCLAVVGIAREVAALTGQKMHIPEIKYDESGEPIANSIDIKIVDADLCPRYCASLITGIKIAESPAWLQERLTAAGQRPINNIVDITNYVMLEYGQPLHSFDYERLRQKKIIVRRARDGEHFLTLDQAERELNSEMLTIADGERTVAIAGVMGGLNSEVTESTTSILLEAASFKAASIHLTSRSLELTSEASMRFERGISAGVTVPALKHATQLVAELGGGKVASGIIDVFPGKKDKQPIVVTPEKTARVLGMPVSREAITGALDGLGIEHKVDGDNVAAVAPEWRSDIRLDVDIIEEIARIIGYDKIPMTMLSDPIPRHSTGKLPELKKKIREILTGFGFYELVTYSLTSLETLGKLAPGAEGPTVAPIRIVKPLSADQDCLRPNLRANVLAALTANRRHEEGGIRLFELGKVYLPRQNDLPDEPEMLCAIISGPRVEKSWLGGDGALDFYDIKGVAEGLLSKLGLNAGFEKGDEAGLHPTRQAAIVVSKDGKSTRVGVIGELHPSVGDTFEIEGPVGILEMDVAALLPLASGYKLFQAISRFPSIVRDMALVVDAGISNRQITEIIKSYGLISEVILFDVYSGKQVAGGKKSLAYRLVYQSTKHTLTDEEVNKVQEQILKRLAAELGATLRA